jgi:hypothetical protein
VSELTVVATLTVSTGSVGATDETVGLSQELAGTPLSWATTVGTVSKKDKSSLGAGVGVVGITVVGHIRSTKSVALGPSSSVSDTRSPQP